MVELVDIDQVKAALRIDHDDEDAILELLIPAASGAVVNYLKDGADGFVDEDGGLIPDAVIPPEVMIATIFLVGVLRRNPDNDTEGAFEQGYLPKPVTALLYPLRRPALA